MKGESDSSYLAGAAAHEVGMTIFDGIALRKKTLPPGTFKIPHTITAGLSGVVFFTGDGFSPEAAIFKAGDRHIAMGRISLLKMKDTKKGVVTGVVYKPVTGGKLVEHIGIAALYRDERVSFMKDGVASSFVTDDRGSYTGELPGGDYTVMPDGSNKRKVIVGPGRTTIINFKKGMVLVD